MNHTDLAYKIALSASGSQSTSTPADEDDILGALAKPVESQRPQSATRGSRPTPPVSFSSSSLDSLPTQPVRPTSSTRPSQHLQSESPSRTIFSPSLSEDHSSATSTPPAMSEAGDVYVAELVDMGFSASHARRALAQTESGTNVQQAVDLLIREAHERAKRLQREGNNEKASSRKPARQQQAHRRPSRYEGSVPVDVLAPHPDDRPRRTRTDNPIDEDEWQSIPSVYSDETTSSERRRRDESLSSQSPTQDFGKMASVFSAHLRSRAEVLWKQGKQTVAKAVEEYQQHSNGGGSGFSDDGNPRWMRSQIRYKFDDDATEVNIEEPIPENKTRREHLATTLEASLLEQQGPPPKPSRPASSHRSSSSSTRLPTSTEKGPPPKPNRPPINQFEDMEQYVPSNRRRPRPPPTPRSQPTPPAPQLRPKPPSRPQVDISSIQLDDLMLSRTEGTEAFKRGDFSSANEFYTQALDMTPSPHLLRTVLLSNRAASLFKLGNMKAALVDAEEGLTIIGTGKGIDEEYEPGKKLVDIWAKLTQRKAEALEQLERFKDAKEAWEELVQSGQGGKVALDGKSRCDKVINPSSSKPSTPSSSTRSTPKPTQRLKSTSIEDSAAAQAALKKIKEENRKLEAVDAEKFALLDGVEAKISAWKHGKEENLRALLGSLDTILWKEAGWVKVGMADLVIPKKVKINYMKAVAKTHPDKVPASATTEQKMIAQAVFVSLNHAWDEFKRQNNIQ